MIYPSRLEYPTRVFLVNFMTEARTTASRRTTHLFFLLSLSLVPDEPLSELKQSPGKSGIPGPAPPSYQNTPTKVDRHLPQSLASPAKLNSALPSI